MTTIPFIRPGRKLPIGIQSFEKLRSEGFLYVDKTAFVYQLAQAGNPCVQSRPRRFGKNNMRLQRLTRVFLSAS